MKKSITHLSLLFAVMVVGMCASIARADSVPNDPRIIVRDPACNDNCQGVGTSFQFGVSGSQELVFQNISGVDWFNLQLTETGVNAPDINCITFIFASCSKSTDANGLTTLLFSGFGGDSQFSGITNNQVFSIIFGCTDSAPALTTDPNECNPWPATSFSASANVSAPEGGSMAMLLIAAAAIFTQRKRWGMVTA